MGKAIVTGANGFVGAAVCKELAAQGFEVIAIVRHQDEIISSIAEIKGIRIVYCDISNFINLNSRVYFLTTPVIHPFC